MIVVRLWGGLGNQMFQYAFGYSVARKTDQELVLDTRFYTDGFIDKNPHFTKQSPNILTLPLIYKEEVNTNGEYKKICFLQNRTVSRMIRIPRSFEIRGLEDLRYIKETRLDVYKKYISNPSANAYYDGYWQSEKYFKEFEEEIRNQFHFQSNQVSDYITRNHIEKKNTVSMHLRFGDYGRKKKIGAYYNYIVPVQYYINALEKVKSYINNPKLFIFSNDIDRAIELLGDKYDYIIVNQDRCMSDIEEFMIMSRCSNHVISNSTFSWWAAWLNDFGFTMAPNMIFGNKQILPTRWVKIPFEK